MNYFAHFSQSRKDPQRRKDISVASSFKTNLRAFRDLCVLARNSTTRRLHIFGIAVIVLLFTGCFEINEIVDIQPNGSGTLSVKMDMSQLLEMMQSYAASDDAAKKLAGKNIDTTLSMKSFTDTSTQLTPDMKALLREGTVHVHLNADDKIFKMDTRFPFSNLSDLQKLYMNMNNKSMNGMSQLFKGMAGRSDTVSAGMGGGNDMPDMSKFNTIYDFQSHDGLLSRKLNADKWKQVQESAQFSQLKDAGSMGISIPYTITVRVPRPVKKVDNSLAVLSADKKEVVIKYNLVDAFQHPEICEYTIAY